MRQKLLNLDLQTTSSLRIAENPGFLRSLSIVLAHSGDSWFWLIGLAFLWWQGTPFWQARAQFMALGVILTAVTVILIKLTVRRRRPEGNWGGLYRTTDPHSFPSGHAARAVLLAVLALFSGPAWFAAILIVWAPLVSLARVAMGVHYLSDILAGMALGLAIGLLLPIFVWF
jgi:membrane-associated phospholipid phosphatase